MSDDDMIRRGDAIAACGWQSDEYHAVRALPAVQVGVKPLPFGSGELDAALAEYTPGIDRAVRFVSIDQVDMLAEFYMQNRSALTAVPSPDVIEIDLRAVMMEEIEKAAEQSPWVPPEYTMNEIISDCCSFLREPREPSPDVAALRDTGLLIDAYKAVLVLHRVMDKHGLTAGAAAAENIADRIVAAHPEFPGLCALRGAALARLKGGA